MTITIDGVIEHYQALAEISRKWKIETPNEPSDFSHNEFFEEQAEECEQIVEWLEELKQRREVE